MVNQQPLVRLCFVLTALQIVLSLATARVTQHARRSDSAVPGPLATSGWTVPLEGGLTCDPSGHCTNSLSSPKGEWQYLVIGRGTITYSCANPSSTSTPRYISQNTFLYDASPLIPKFSSEAQFHSYIPRFLQYDYTSLDNSSLTCIGTVQRVDNLNIFTIYEVDAFPVTVKEAVNSPEDSTFDLDWALEESDDAMWEVYRVVTAAGAPPYNCGDQIIDQRIPVEYAAEYWFFRREGS